MFAYLTLLLTLLTSLQQKSPDVILVTLDGTRWQEIYNGTDSLRYPSRPLTPRELVPNLYNYFIDQGIAIGKETPMIVSGPNHVSLPGYLEITRGHPSVDCQSNDCDPNIDESIFWFFQHPAVFSSWRTIEKTIPVTAPQTYQDVGSLWYRWDLATELAVVDYLQDHDPDFLWVALGDTDELAHQDNYLQYLQSLQMADDFIGLLVRRYPESTFIVTTDHGRSHNFKDHGRDKESERVWLMMRGPSIPNKGFVTAPILTLSNIMPTIIDVEFGTHSYNSILSKIQ